MSSDPYRDFPATDVDPLSAEKSEGTFQQRVWPWMLACFGAEIASDRDERNHRFLEEALELVQSCGCTKDEAHQLVDYVYGRPEGETAQEIGGVMVTLAALCLANDLDMHDAAETELARVWTKVDVIRAKQAAKPKHSPLPGPSIPDTPADSADARIAELRRLSEAATPGKAVTCRKWSRTIVGHTYPVVCGEHPIAFVPAWDEDGGPDAPAAPDEAKANADLVAAAVNFVRDLLSGRVSLSEMDAVALPISMAGRQWSIDEQSGDLFEEDVDYRGLALTIEVKSKEEAAAITARLTGEGSE